MTAAQQWEHDLGAERQSGSETSIFDNGLWSFNSEVFRDCRDITPRDLQRKLDKGLGVDLLVIKQRMRDGTAFAIVAADFQDVANADRRQSELRFN
jgi:hypothetical protein